MTCPGCEKKDETMRKMLPWLEHLDEQYLGDHWATGACPRCLAEIALGLRNPNVGGRTLKANAALSAPAPDLVAVPRELLERVAESLRQGHNTLSEWSRCPCDFDSPCPHAAAERELAAVLRSSEHRLGEEASD